MKKVRLLVGCRPQIERIVAEKQLTLPVRRQERADTFRVIVAVQYVETIPLAALNSGKVGCVEETILSPTTQRQQLRCRKRLPLYQKCYGCPASYQHQTAGGAQTHLFQRRDRRGEQFQLIPRRHAHPASSSERPVWAQTAKIRFEGLARVKIVLGHGTGAHG